MGLDAQRKHKRTCQRRLHFHFDSEALENLLHEENSCIELVTSDHKTLLYPSELSSDLKSSIKDILNDEMQTYNSRLGGIPIGFKNPRLKSSLGRILRSDVFYNFVDCEIDFYIFKPEKGRILHGVVNKTSKDHLACLVHRIFNVSIPKPEIDEKWLGKHAKRGAKVALKITHTNFDSLLPYIRGEIVEILSQPVKDEEPETETSAVLNDCTQMEESFLEETPRKKKKKKRDVEES